MPLTTPEKLVPVICVFEEFNIPVILEFFDIDPLYTLTEVGSDRLVPFVVKVKIH